MIKQIRKSYIWYLFILPSFVSFALFVAYPTFESFRLSFYREIATQQVFVGLTQYQRLLTDAVFKDALINTVGLGLVFLILVIPISLVLASLQNNLRIAPSVFKVIYFLPQITSTVAIALIFQYIFQPDWGLLNGALRSLGINPAPLWLADPRP